MAVDSERLLLEMVEEVGSLKILELLTAADRAVRNGRRGITWGGDFAKDSWSIAVDAERVSFRRIRGPTHSLRRDQVLELITCAN